MSRRILGVAACTWLVFDKEVEPRGEEPFYEGPSPGGGCLGRK